MCFVLPCLLYIQLNGGFQRTKLTRVDDVVIQADQQEAKGGLIRSFRCQGNTLAGSGNLSPASSGVGMDGSYAL